MVKYLQTLKVNPNTADNVRYELRVSFSLLFLRVHYKRYFDALTETRILDLYLKARRCASLTFSYESSLRPRGCGALV